MRLDGRVAAVTGAAGGIGLATVKALAARGCRVAAADVDGDRLAAADLPPGASRHVVNVADEGEVRRFAAEVVERHGAAHVIVNNAGVTCLGTFEEHSEADFRRIMDVNLWGVVYGCRAFLPHLRKAGEGHVVNISSLFGIVAVPGQSAYCASKFAVRGFSEALAEELRFARIGVTVVHPGTVGTNIVKAATHAQGAPKDVPLMDGAHRYFERWGAKPSSVADRIVRAVERNEPRALVTPETYAGDLLRRLMPVAGNRLAVRVICKSLGLDVDTLSRRVNNPGR